MKILIVDDQHTKVQRISDAAKAAGLDVSFSHETNATSARRRLHSENFDLLLIDLKLPDVAGDNPAQEGGLNFFDLLIMDSNAEIPSEILFITSEEGLAEEGHKKHKNEEGLFA